MSAVCKCARVACYNQRNGRGCWTATHPDGRQTFEWPTFAKACEASRKDYEEVVKADPARRHKLC